MPPASNRTVLAALLAGNLVPLVGVLFFGWDGWVIIAAYFIETILVGLFNVVKMALILRHNPDAEGDVTGPKGVGLIVFFIFHYGFFISVQLALFAGFATPLSDAFSGDSFFGIGSFLGGALAQEGRYIVLALGLGLTASFVLDFLLPGAYRTTQMGRQMFAPYLRVFVQQFVVIFGGFFVLLLESPTPVVVLLVLFKTGADLASERQWLAKVKTWQVVLPGDVEPPAGAAT